MTGPGAIKIRTTGAGAPCNVGDQGYGSGSLMDPHSFSLLDPDPRRKVFKIKTKTWKEKGTVIIVILFKFLKQICTSLIVFYLFTYVFFNYRKLIIS